MGAVSKICKVVEVRSWKTSGGRGFDTQKQISSALHLILHGCQNVYAGCVREVYGMLLV
jgi:hypothetical protein